MLHLAPDLARGHGKRCIGRSAGLDISAVAGQHVLAAAAKIAFVVDLSTGRVYLHQRARHRIEGNIAAHGGDFHVPVADIGQRHRTVQGPDVHVGIADVTHFHIGLAAFQGHIAVQALGMQQAGGGAQGDAGIGRNRYLVVPTSGVGIG